MQSLWLHEPRYCVQYMDVHTRSHTARCLLCIPKEDEEEEAGAGW